MRKRFTDADKWDHKWFRVLKPKMKCALQYVFDCCDPAGVWVADFDSMSFHVGEEVTEEEFCQAFKEKIIKFDSDKFYVQDFIVFQYGDKEGLVSEANAVVITALAILKKNQLEFKGSFAPPKGGAGAPPKGVKEKEEEKRKEEGEEIPERVYSVAEISNARNTAAKIVSQIFSRGREEPWVPGTKLEIEAIKGFGGVIQILDSKKTQKALIDEMKRAILPCMDTG
nr:hypothetical protein BHI3_07460 [Bacteriovorax sp. HI3]